MSTYTEKKTAYRNEMFRLVERYYQSGLTHCESGW